MRTSAEILLSIEAAAGDGSCPQGLDIFTSSEVLKNDDLHCNYTFEAAVRYLMRIRPDDAAISEAETHVEQSEAT